MFARIKERCFGNKKKATAIPSATSKKEAKRNKGKQSDTVARPDSEIRSGSFDLNDEFRKHDVDGFELVMIDKNNLQENAETIGSVTPVQNVELGLPTSPEHREELEVTAVEESDNDVPDSVVDLATQQNKVEDSSGNVEVNLSFDEMQALDIFDSVVNNIAAASDDDNEFDETVDHNASESEAADEESEHENNFQLSETSVDSISKVDRSIDYQKVLGDVSDSQSESSEPQNNWQITGFTRQISLRFVAKAGMYLPSPQEDPLSEFPNDAPELPPTDYLKVDDERDPDSQQKDFDERGSNEKESNKKARSSPTKAPTVTSFSCKSREQTSTANVTKSEEHPGSISSGTSQVDIDNGIVLENGNAKIMLKKTETTSTTDSIPSSYDGKVIITERPEFEHSHSLPKPKRHIPRVTSFKSSISPPKLITRPVNDLVKRFEHFPTEEAF